MRIFQIIIAILLTLVILVQNRGTGLSGIFGGDGNVYRSRRGIEKNLFIATIILSILFFAISIATLLF